MTLAVPSYRHSNLNSDTFSIDTLKSGVNQAPNYLISAIWWVRRKLWQTCLALVKTGMGTEDTEIHDASESKSEP